MGKVYRIGSIHGTTYVNTVREANAEKPGGEEPESVDCVDSAGECNRLNRMVDETERRLESVRYLLAELMEDCPSDILFNTKAGKAAFDYMAANPLPVVTCADRDGGRSYGTG